MSFGLSEEDRAGVEAARGSAGIPVAMIRDNLADIPESPIPSGYTFGPIAREQIGLWTDIERDAEPFFGIDLAMFTSSFGTDISEISRRCHILYDERGCGIGTISAWQEGIVRGIECGRVHWVAIRAAFQGRGLGKTLMSFGLQEMKRLNHHGALLETQSKREAAIGLYLKYGFRPSIATAAHRVAWEEIRAHRAHPLLNDLDQYQIGA